MITMYSERKEKKIGNIDLKKVRFLAHESLPHDPQNPEADTLNHIFLKRTLHAFKSVFLSSLPILLVLLEKIEKKREKGLPTHM